MDFKPISVGLIKDDRLISTKVFGKPEQFIKDYEELNESQK